MLRVMPSRTAVIGSRDYPRMDAVRAWFRDGRRTDGDVILSGGARGVDRLAIECAKAQGYATEEFLADWEKHGKAAGFIRNKALVDAADFVIAFWDGESRGTKHAMDYARSREKPVIVFGPDGRSHGTYIGQDVRKPTPRHRTLAGFVE